MIQSQKQYLVAVEKIANLRSYLFSAKNYPIKDEVIQKAIEQGLQSLIDELEGECLVYLDNH